MNRLPFFCHSIKTMFCIVTTLLCLSLQAQEGYTFTQYTTEDGLSEATINDILQDKKGFLWLATWNGLTRFDGYTFRYFPNTVDTSIGFTNNRISRIGEDSLGNIWILSYDKKLSLFDRKTEQVTNISGENCWVKAFYILPNGRVWLSTENRGILLLKDTGGNHTSFEEISSKLHLPYESKLINAISADQENGDWLLTAQGLYRYSGDTGETTAFCNAKRSFSCMQVTKEHTYIATENGEIWKFDMKNLKHTVLKLPTPSYVTALCLLENDELFCGTMNDGFYIITTDGKEKCHHHIGNSNVMPDNWIKNVQKDSHQNLWIHQKTAGITYYDTKEDKVYRYHIEDKNGKPILHGRQKAMIAEDRLGNIFVHPVGGGLGLFNWNTKSLPPFYNRQLQDGWGISNTIMNLFADREGNVWLNSNINGLEKVTPAKDIFSLYAPSELQEEQIDSRAIFIDRNQRLWIGFKHSGIGIYDADHHFLGYLQKDGSISRKGTNKVSLMAYTIMQDHEGNIWIGTKKYGVMKATPKGNGKNFHLTSFEYDASDIYSLSNNDVQYIYEDNEHRIWFLTLNGGINYLERDIEGNYRFINHRNQLKNYPIDACSKTRAILSDKKGNLWLATANGLVVFKEKFIHPSDIRFTLIHNIPGAIGSLSNNDIQFLHQTSRNELYIATFGGGLNRLLSYEDGKARFKSYTKKSGLLSNILFTLQEDRGGHLWITMMEGISRFNPDTEVIENYSGNDFPKNIKFNDGTGCYSNTNKIMILNTLQGPLYFKPEEVHKSSYIPSIAFTSLQLDDCTVSPQDSTGVLDASIDDISQLTLSHEQNSFSIQFSALDMNSGHSILYKYRLKGFENNWSGAGDSHIANYTNIPKGNYVFEVCSTNSDGVWQENIRRLPISILPSFWETPWAILLYIFGVLVCIGSVVYVLFTFYRLRHKVEVEQELSELKIRFFTNVSHELRTPLTLIAGPIKNVLEHSNLPSDIRNQLRLVDQNTNRMSNLINQLLDFRKVQNKKMKLQVQQIELVDFIQHLMECFSTLAGAQQINFTLEHTSAQIQIWADGDKLEKIVFNLLSNTFKYTPRGKQIKIALKETEQEVQIIIADQGIGIPENKQKLLFERFETLSFANTINQASTGIGLSLVKELVEMHHGTVAFHSKPGEGTTFTVSLKKGKSHFNENTEFILSDGNLPEMYHWNEGVPLSDQECGHSPEMDTTEDIENKPSVLIVEDNKELRYFLRMAFNTDFHIIEAENGMDGLEQAREQMPDIIVSDIMMPVKDGIELLEDLRTDIAISHIPVVLLTAKSAVENRIEGIELGAEDYITKPFSINYLKARIQNILNQRRRLQEYYCSTPLPPQDSLLEEAQKNLVDTITTNDQSFMKRLLDSVYKHLSNGNLKIEELAKEVGMSRAVFFKKIKSLTGLSPVEFLKDVRLKQAAQLILSTDLSMSQIAFEVGFNDAHYFSKCFKQKFGTTPTEYKEAEIEQRT